jgi:AmmeMemoRadiSam system protein A
MSLTPEQRRQLVALARDAVVRRIVSGRPPAISDLAVSDLSIADSSGVFVTVRVAGRLRGCLGALESRRGLADDVVACAADAATRDPRFTPISPDELGALSLEVSVLGPFVPIDPPDPSAIVIGEHGLLVERGRHRGLLLPQVAVEWGWDATMFLRQACVKAGLPPDAWQQGAAVSRFIADVFGGGATE